MNSAQQDSVEPRALSLVTTDEIEERPHENPRSGREETGGLHAVAASAESGCPMGESSAACELEPPDPKIVPSTLSRTLTIATALLIPSSKQTVMMPAD